MVSRRSRWTTRTLGCALTMMSVSAFGVPAVADDAGDLVLSTSALEVRVSSDFPQVISYTHRADGALMHGNDEPLSSIEINGTSVPVAVTSTQSSGSSADYRLVPQGLDQVELAIRLSVEDNVVTMSVTEIEDPGNAVKTIRLPGQNLVTVSSAQPGAAVSAANLSVDRAVSGDTFIPVTAKTPTDPVPVSSNTVIANTDGLAAAFATNALYEDSSGPAAKDAGNFWRQARTVGDEVEVGISSGPWLYRAGGAKETEELPWVKVAITPDANDDGRVDWQDGAIATRDIRPAPFRGDEVADTVVNHIPFNFASQATHPFLRTLDDIKRIARGTDGLGQAAMLKGYTSEGHDSANTDYGDNFNDRAGGLEDLNSAAAAAEDWNASLGVHINATEIYPEANSFSDELAEADKPNWNWLDQAYLIDQRFDINSGQLDERITELAEATHDNLDFVYVDVYYQFGWRAQKLQDSLIDKGFRVSSEWADKLSENNTWSHWANDENYGGSKNKGVNSQILRFIGNTHADVWNPDPRLGASHIVEFEGWTGQNDYTAFSRNIWEANLPTKFLQHHEITRWDDEAIDLAGGVKVTGSSAANRSITVGGAEVLRGGTYLLPWASEAGEKNDKLYHYNPNGGTTTWTLTGDFAGVGSFQVFSLGDDGRTDVGTARVVDGRVTVEAKAGQPYVLVPASSERAGSALPETTDFGEATPVDDPGFNGPNLDSWNPRGAVSIDRDGLGRRSAKFGRGAGSLSQRLDRLPAGEYTVSAWVGVDPGASRDVTVRVELPEGEAVEKTISSSRLSNTVAADEWSGTTLQRLSVPVTIPKQGGGEPTLTVSAGDGAAAVRVDDVRVIRSAAPEVGGAVIAAEDFEDVDSGWGPFYKGSSGGTTDPRTHIAKRHEPYTQKGWNGRRIDNILNGDWSLMAHEENRGTVYRTTPYTVPFAPGHRYRVSFDYQSTAANEYEWITGADTATGAQVTKRTPIGAVHETTRFEQTFDTGNQAEAFVGLERVGGGAADFILDDFRVEDLGPSQQPQAGDR